MDDAILHGKQVDDQVPNNLHLDNRKMGNHRPKISRWGRGERKPQGAEEEGLSAGHKSPVLPFGTPPGEKFAAFPPCFESLPFADCKALRKRFSRWLLPPAAGSPAWERGACNQIRSCLRSRPCS